MGARTRITGRLSGHATRPTSAFGLSLNQGTGRHHVMSGARRFSLLPGRLGSPVSPPRRGVDWGAGLATGASSGITRASGQCLRPGGCARHGPRGSSHKQPALCTTNHNHGGRASCLILGSSGRQGPQARRRPARARQSGPLLSVSPVRYLHDSCITGSTKAVPDGNARLYPGGGPVVRPQGRQGPANF